LKKLRHSKIGVVSFSVSLIPIMYIIIQIVIDMFVVKYTENEKTAFLLMNIMILIGLISFVLGIVSMFQKSTRKSLPVIGMIISCLILVIPILGGAKTLYNGSNKLLNINSNDNINITFTPEIEIVDEDFSLRKGDIVVKLNMNKNELLKAIGVNNLNSSNEENVTLKNKNYKYINYDFQGLNITLSNVFWDESNSKEDDFVVNMLKTNSNHWQTYRGLTVDSDINKVESVYGKLIRSEGKNGFSLVLAKDKSFLNFISSSSNKQKIGQIYISE